MKRKKLNVFSLSFLDIITCGLGAIILLFVLINAKSAAHQDTVTSDFRAEASRMERLVLDGKKHLIEARNSLENTETDLVKIQGLSRRIIAILKEHKVELADQDKETLAAKAHVNKLKADLKSLEEDVKRLRAGAKASEDLGSKLRPFPGKGDRQYLTDLKMGGKRIFILVDASASMLDETIVGIIRKRNQGLKAKLTAPKWKQAVATLDWLTTQLPPTSKFQVYAFNETAGPLIPGTQETWLAQRRRCESAESDRRAHAQIGPAKRHQFDECLQGPKGNETGTGQHLPTGRQPADHGGQKALGQTSFR